MAVLDDTDRRAVWADVMRGIATLALGTVSITKADLRAAVDALDSFLDTNAAALNTAIPQPARGSLSSRQKALMLMYVLSKRYLRA